MNELNLMSKIQEVLSEQHLTQKKLCAELNITENGFRYMMSKNTMKIERLKKIAQILKIPISYFFEDQENKTRSYEDKMVGERNQRMRPYLIVDEKERTIDKLEQLVEEKNKVIKMLEEKVEASENIKGIISEKN